MRTLSEWLRERSDDELRNLLVARSDLVNPVPPDVGALAERAATQASVSRALDRLDRATLRVLEALSTLPEPVSRDDLLAALPDGHATVAEAVRQLRALALVWGDDVLRLVPAVRGVLPAPAGLGPPAAAAFREVASPRLRTLLANLGLEVEAEPDTAADALASHLAEPETLDGLLAEVSAEAREVLDQLAWGPPFGKVPDASREVRIAEATSPVEQLLARGLLVPADAGSVVLPRELALHLRGGLLFRQPDPAPALEVAEHDSERAERTAAGQAFTALRKVEELLEWWGVDPPPVLRAGGLGQRDLRRTARELSITEEVAALYIEVAYAAGLLATDTRIDGDWVPTKAYDVWRNRSPQQQWAAVASAWLQTGRVPSLVGDRDERDKPINALGQGLYRPHAGEARRAVLEVLAGAPPGGAPSGESVRARLAWLRPRRWSRARDRLVAWTVAEAETLGLTGLGALSAHGRALLSEDGGQAAAVLAPRLPEPVDHVLVQPDLTAVAPGPLTRELGRQLALAADVESTGGATVYRFTRDSLRRALDAGSSASDLLEMLERHSRTPIPQPLRYLVEDVARAHGRIRVGTAAAYVRCDDPGTLTELLSDRRAARLGLRRLADTVLASRTGRQELLERLRALGYAPVAESMEGDVLVSRAETRRSGAPDRPPHQGEEGARPDERVAEAAVRALRVGERAAATSRRPLQAGNGAGDRYSEGLPPRTSSTSTVAALRSATDSRQPLWIGYLDAQGRASSRIVEPVRVEGGFLTAYDSTRDAVHRFALHRVTGVAELDGDPT